MTLFCFFSAFVRTLCILNNSPSSRRPTVEHRLVRQSHVSRERPDRVQLVAERCPESVRLLVALCLALDVELSSPNFRTNCFEGMTHRVRARNREDSRVALEADAAAREVLDLVPDSACGNYGFFCICFISVKWSVFLIEQKKTEIRSLTANCVRVRCPRADRCRCC